MIPQRGGGRARIQTHWEVSQWVASNHGRALRPGHQLLSAIHLRAPQRLDHLTHDSGFSELPHLLRPHMKEPHLPLLLPAFLLSLHI